MKNQDQGITAYYHERRLQKDICKRYYHEIDKAIYYLTYSFFVDYRDIQVEENVYMALRAYRMDRPDLKELTGKFVVDYAVHFEGGYLGCEVRIEHKDCEKDTNNLLLSEEEARTNAEWLLSLPSTEAIYHMMIEKREVLIQVVPYLIDAENESKLLINYLQRCNFRFFPLEILSWKLLKAVVTPALSSSDMEELKELGSCLYCREVNEKGTAISYNPLEKYWEIFKNTGRKDENGEKV